MKKIIGNVIFLVIAIALIPVLTSVINASANETITLEVNTTNEYYNNSDKALLILNNFKDVIKMEAIIEGDRYKVESYDMVEDDDGDYFSITFDFDTYKILDEFYPDNFVEPHNYAIPDYILEVTYLNPNVSKTITTMLSLIPLLFVVLYVIVPFIRSKWL